MGRRSREKQLRREQAQRLALPEPPISDERIQRLLDSGAARVLDDGTVEMETRDAWKIDPWIWAAGADLGPEVYLRAGTDPPKMVYINRDFQVAVFDEPGPKGWPDMWHLSIKRRDREPIDESRWRILQRIKNTILGPEYEGVELYPAESRLVDTSNQYHLFVIKDTGIRFPFGFTERAVTSQSMHGTQQRPLDPDTSETDPNALSAQLKAAFGDSEE